MAPFTVLHVCMGNICRSPMAERLLARALRDRAGDAADELVRSVSAGTGGWHEGEQMNPPAARLVRARGGSVTGFEARKLRGDFIDEADLIFTATADQYDYVVALRPEAATRTFVLGEFGRLLGAVDASAQPGDDLDDPSGRGDQTFQRIGDEIEDTTVPFAALLLP